MSPLDFAWSIPVLAPHVAAVALCAARLLPVGFLCPFFGGPLVPASVRLGLVLSLGLALHFEGGVAAPADATRSLFVFGAEVLRELALGMALGLVAALPLDAARMGGRFVDLFRGASAEATLPFVGARESASGHLLYQLMIAACCTGPLLPWVLPPLWKSFAVLRLGTALATEGGALALAGQLTRAMGTGLALGAPIAGLALGADCLWGLAARAAPQLRLQEAATPLKLLGGGALLWLALGLLMQRLLGEISLAEMALGRILELSR